METKCFNNLTGAFQYVPCEVLAYKGDEYLIRYKDLNLGTFKDCWVTEDRLKFPENDESSTPC